MRPRVTWLWLVVLALGGLLAGHLASYFVVAPDAHERAELLALTGHSEHSAFGTLALAATFASIIGIFMQRIRARRGPRTSRARVAAFLWALQTAGFVALEAWERGHGLGGVAELLHEPAFLIGLVAQVAVALVATALVLLVRATAAALLRLLVLPASTSEPPAFTSAPDAHQRESVARSAWNLRGPPSPLGSPS